MILTPPHGPAEAVRFIDQIIADDRLAALVAATRSAGVADMRHYVRGRRGRLSADEQDQVDRVLRCWASVKEAGAAPPQRSRRARLAWLQDFARDRWDMRCGQERDRIPTSMELLPPAVADRVDELARAWGMRGPLPVSGAFGAAVILGGFLPSNLNRAAAAAQLRHTGAVSYPLAIGLACLRPLSAAEQRLALAFEIAARTESDTMAYAMAAAFGVAGSPWRVGDPVREQVGDDGLRLLVTEVPLRPDGSRPNTGESFAWLLSTGLLEVEASVLCVTTPLYWIQNHVNLLTQLPPPGAVLVTTGAPCDAAGPLQPVYRSQHYLQEIKAAIDALPELLDCAGG
jgi:hypothetical protein